MVSWLYCWMVGGCLCFLAINMEAQTAVNTHFTARKSLGDLKQWVKFSPKFIEPSSKTIVFALDRFELPTTNPSNKHKFLQSSVVDAAYDPAFFCRIEHQLSLKINMPFKFRLGSVQYVDWLEGKPGCSSYLP